MKRRIVIEVDDELVDQRANAVGGCEELTGLCFLAAPKHWHENVHQLPEMLARHGITVISDEEIVP